MKTIFKSVLTLGLVAGLGIAANAQVAASAPASAEILAELTITVSGAINFGVISNTTGAGVILDANGVNNVNTGFDRSVALFEVSGAPSTNITVNYDPTVDLVFSGVLDPLDPQPGEIIVMTPEVVGSDVDSSIAEQGTAATISQGGTVSTNATGEFFIWAGGALTAGGPYAVGVYSGTFNINVEYN